MYISAVNIVRLWYVTQQLYLQSYDGDSIPCFI